MSLRWRTVRSSECSRVNGDSEEGDFPRAFARAFSSRLLSRSKAYKQAPVHPEDRHELVIGVRGPAGKVCFFTHNALPFGASAAPFQFSRLAHALVSVAQGIFRLPVQNYLDDFWGIENPETAASSFRAFWAFHKITGLRLQRKKMQFPSRKFELLRKSEGKLFKKQSIQ